MIELVRKEEVTFQYVNYLAVPMPTEPEGRRQLTTLTRLREFENAEKRLLPTSVEFRRRLSQSEWSCKVVVPYAVEREIQRERPRGIYVYNSSVTELFYKLWKSKVGLASPVAHHSKSVPTCRLNTFKAFGAQLSPPSRLLIAAKGNGSVKEKILILPNCTGLQASRHTMNLVSIQRMYASS